MGPAGCNGFRLPGVPSLYSSGNPLGFLINSDTNSNVLGGIRLADGSSVYVFGTFQENGNIEKITGAAVRDTDGNEASIIFEDGRPTKARGFDGSTLEITYDEVGIERLKGHVDLYFAGENVAEEDREQRVEFDVNLQEAAVDLANRVADLLGLEILDEEPPEEDPGGRLRLADNVQMPFGKDVGNSQLILIFAPFYQFAFVTVGFLCIQVMAVMVAVLLETVVVMMQAMVIAVFTPFILMCNMMRMAFSLSTVAIDFTLDLGGSGVIIPPYPDYSPK
jgi:hypothetical protein